MKKYILTLLVGVGLLSCNQDEIAKQKATQDSLLTVLRQTEAQNREREISVNEFISSFNEVERNLDSVAARQQLLNLQTDKSRGDVKASQKDRINAQIQAINALMESNRNTIADLKKKLKGSSRTNAKLKETLATLQSQLEQKDAELAGLNEKLNAVNSQLVRLQTSFDSLTVQNTNRSKTIEENTLALHTAYYVVGRAKELQAAKLIDRSGGVLGLGKTIKLHSNVDNSKFTRIDYTKVTSIDLNTKDVKFVTAHPEGSYSLERDPQKKNLIRTLVITQPERFWSLSRYLVIAGEPMGDSRALSSAEKKEEIKH